MKKILIIASDPRKDLNLDDEIRLLRNAVDQSRDRELIEIVSEPAVQVGDLQRLLLRHKPQIVHFCGHGSGESGLIFKMDGEGEQRVRADALADMFALNPICSNVKCVLLNACYSEQQADAIVRSVDYVVGMSHEIQDDAAIAFSKGFYLALGYGCSIDDSFEFGKNAIQLEISGNSKTRSVLSETQRKMEVIDVVTNASIPEHQKPILKKRESSNIPSTNPTLSQEKKVEIQLDIDKTLEEDTKVKQYREQAKESNSDRQAEIETLIDQREFEKAISKCQEILRLSPDDIKTRCYLGIALCELGKLESAEAEFNKALHLDPNMLRSHIGLGDVFYYRGKLESAIANYHQAIQINPDAPENALAYNNLGAILHDQGKLEQAEAEYNKALHLDPNMVTPHIMLGAILHDRGKLESAEAKYHQAIQINSVAPENALAYNNLGTILYNQGKLESAEAEYNKALHLDPNMVTSHIMLGRILDDRGKLESAISKYHQAIQINPDAPENAIAYNNLGLILYNQGKLESAEAELNKALHLDPNLVMSHIGLGDILRDRGNIQEAIAKYYQAIYINPDAPENALAYNNLGLILYDQGKFKEAEAEFQKAIRLNPNNDLICKNLKKAQKGWWGRLF